MNLNKSVQFALSLKQPWAALVAHGLKTIEIRSWPTARRGRILVHAARVCDSRPEAWKQVPSFVQSTAKLEGGIVGSVDLIDCVSYGNLEAFLADQRLHHNEADWFRPPVLYGFKFGDARVLPFRKLPGWFRFFKVEENELARAG
jgi:hypothetical protein